jgi:hypothetical protein
LGSVDAPPQFARMRVGRRQPFATFSTVTIIC